MFLIACGSNGPTNIPEEFFGVWENDLWVQVVIDNDRIDHHFGKLSEDTRSYEDCSEYDGDMSFLGEYTLCIHSMNFDRFYTYLNDQMSFYVVGKNNNEPYEFERIE